MQIPGSVFHSNLHGQCGSFPRSLLPVRAGISWMKTRGLWTEKPRVEVKGWQALQGGAISLQVRNLAGKTRLGVSTLSCVSEIPMSCWRPFWDSQTGLSFPQLKLCLGAQGALPGVLQGEGQTPWEFGAGASLGLAPCYQLRVPLAEGTRRGNSSQQRSCWAQIKGSGGQNCRGHSSVGSRTWLSNI